MSDQTQTPGTPAPTPPESTGRAGRVLFQLFLIVAFIVVAGGIMVALVASKTTPPKAPSREAGPLVAVAHATTTNVPVQVTGHGTVEPRHRVDIIPQVSGKIVKVHPNLIDGGSIAKDELLIQIDKADYLLAKQAATADLNSATAAHEQAQAGLDQATASVRRAETMLAIEKAEAAARVSEWKAVNGDKPIPELVARQPQIKEKQAELTSAKAMLKSAEAAVRVALGAKQSAQTRLDRAELDLERTTIVASSACRVLNEQVDQDQFVNAGQVLATVYAVNRLQIVTPLDDAQLEWFDLPTLDGSQATLYDRGVPTTITSQFAGKLHTWSGKAVRTTGQVDPRSRLVHVVIEVANPMSSVGRPMEPGMFVDVAIQGRTLTDVIQIPRHAVRQDGKVWVARTAPDSYSMRGWLLFDYGETADAMEWPTLPAGNKTVLRKVPIEVRRTDREHAYIRSGLKPGDIVITSQMDVVVDGMRVRVPQQDEPAKQATAGAVR